MSAHRRDWEDLAQLDPLWAISSVPGRRFGGWEDEAFAASGAHKVQALLRRLEGLDVPARRARALDFGCGVGRLTLPLADAFDAVVGLDIAPAMVERARERAAGRGGVRFVVADDPSALGDERYDLVYTGLVLQHQPSAPVAARLLAELAARVAPGGVLVAQVPVALALRHRLQPGRRLYGLLRRAGVPREVVYRRLRLQPMRMTWVPRAEVERVLQAAGLRLLAADERDAGGVRSLTVYAVDG